ncbi:MULTISPECIES: DUF4349 domain-containing protein [Niastella]|uniref:DUF4349 domain-containing protein n=1 Tax=Niastella soli TaxID=2821487 RepID=A0ABS3YW94_9BACT|nr:DUF4349 domain-containing protein [Niastella soli]MBO9201792.1 DUF4349 domain-containing protein [Niastella soli]
MFTAYKPVLMVTSIAITLLIACNSNSESKQGSTTDVALAATTKNIPAQERNAAYGVLDTVDAPVPIKEEEAPPQTGAAAPAQHIDWDKKIIKNATLIIEAKKQKPFNDFVHEQVKRTGGYVAEEEQTKTEYKIENVTTIKVPVDQFDNLVKSLTSTTDENIITQKVTSQDVTGEVIDTRSRTEAKRQIRLRYLDLLKQAKNMEDILKVQEEINNIQEEIEAGAGRVSYLTHAAAYSTIQLTFYEVLNASAEHDRSPGFGTRVLNALSNGMDWLGELLVVLLTLWPLWLSAAALFWWFRKWKAKPKLKAGQ